MIDRVTQVLNARWLIAHEVIGSYVPLLFSFLSGNTSLFKSDENGPKPYALSVIRGQVNTADQWDLSSPDLPLNTVAVIPIVGEILSWKSMRLVSWISEAEANPNIIAIVFLVNTPGGMVFYTDIAAASIKAMMKPSVSFVMNMAASAGIWLISPTKRIVASSPLDRFGSIGVMASIMDFTRMLKEKFQIDVFEIYASKSSRKNFEMRNLLDSALTIEERIQPIVNDLDYVNEFFHQAIRDNLGIKEDSEVFDGGMYNAQRAIELSLAHEIMSFEDAVSLAHQMGLTNTINHFLLTN